MLITLFLLLFILMKILTGVTVNVLHFYEGYFLSITNILFLFFLL